MTCNWVLAKQVHKNVLTIVHKEADRNINQSCNQNLLVQVVATNLKLSAAVGLADEGLQYTCCSISDSQGNTQEELVTEAYCTQFVFVIHFADVNDVDLPLHFGNEKCHH